ncbi:MAG: B12 lower ligand biosynthesis radical SAM protein BzaD [Nitrospirae bacterium]|nr:B12 lower ligand biosynthesis radical SAM protein BzaD [Nitrospirota bacterium]
MRVLLIQTPSVEGIAQEKVYPLGIATLGGSLEHSGCKVELLDMNIEADPFGAVKKRLLGFRPDVVGLSLRNIDPLANKTSSLVPPFLVTAALVASVLPKARLVAGGTGFSLFPERLMREAPEIHYGIIGEAETSLPALLASLDNPPALKGLCARRGKGIHVTPPSGGLAMAHYAPPRRHLLDPALYSGINSYVPPIGIETKRGCPFHCAYCVYPKLQGRRVRCRPPFEVVNEMESLHREYGVERFHFTDPVANFPEGHLEDICRELVRRKVRVKWDAFLREDYFNEGNAALFERAGCECFSFSPDGLCRESLDVLDKRLSERDVLKAATLAAATDVMSVYHFMVNVPGETEKTCEKGIRMIETIYDRHVRKKNLGTVVLNNIRILPGTPIEVLARKLGVVGPETDLLYPTYFNPEPFQTFRYRLEALHLSRNVFMWQQERKNEDSAA